LREAVLLFKDETGAAIRAAEGLSADRASRRAYQAAAQPDSLCGEDTRAAGSQLGRKTAEMAAGDIMGQAGSRAGRYARPLDYQEESLAQDWPGPEQAARHLGALYSGQTLSLGQLREGENILESLSDALPPPELSPASQRSPAGRAYMAQRKDYRTRQAIYQSVLARRLADRAPSVEGLEPWARERWLGMGGEGDPPGLVDGRLSREALAWLQANQRLSSANWHEGALPALPEAGLLRELAAMQALSLELMRRQEEHLGNISALLALEGLERLEDGPRRQALRRQEAKASALE
jgi:hypothetical protein